MRTNLIAGKRGKELLATVLYETSTTADWFNDWFVVPPEIWTSR